MTEPIGQQKGKTESKSKRLTFFSRPARGFVSGVKMLCLWGSWAAHAWHRVPVTVVAFLPRYSFPIPKMQSARKKAVVCAPERAPGAQEQAAGSAPLRTGAVVPSSEPRTPKLSANAAHLTACEKTCWRGARRGLGWGVSGGNFGPAPRSWVFYKLSGRTEHPGGCAWSGGGCELLGDSCTPHGRQGWERGERVGRILLKSYTARAAR